jgi:NAD(P)-dependent dehydrogenase (short-subunit alcohol dehydrogenase family)
VNLAGSVVGITGAGRGLGRAIAEAFAARGANLVLGARTTPEIDDLASQLSNAVAVQTDVRDPGDLTRMVDAAVGEFGRLDVWVNNAGLAVYGPFEDVTEDDFDRMVLTNLKGTFFGSQAAYKVMKQQRSGLIVNISSIAGKLHLPNESAYGATKWAVNGFTGTLRLEAARHNVTVTCVCPGGIDTPFWKAMDFFPFPVDRIDPARDFLDPADVARTVVQVAEASDRTVLPEVVVVPLLPQL